MGPTVLLAVRVMTPTSFTETTARAPRGRKAAGFTLLELMIVCAVLALALGLTIPSLRGDGGSFRGEVRKAVATLTYSRRAAIVEASPWTAAFHALDPDSADYRERKDELADADVTASTSWVTESVTLLFQTDDNESAEPVESVEVMFFPQGGSTGGIVTLSRGSQSARVRIDPITGRIATAYGDEEFDAAF